MVPLIIITVKWNTTCIKRHNFRVLYFDYQCLKMIQGSACDTLKWLALWCTSFACVSSWDNFLLQWNHWNIFVIGFKQTAQWLVHTVRGTVCQSVYSKLKSSEMSTGNQLLTFQKSWLPPSGWKHQAALECCNIHTDLHCHIPQDLFSNNNVKTFFTKTYLSSIGCALLYC